MKKILESQKSNLNLEAGITDKIIWIWQTLELQSIFICK